MDCTCWYYFKLWSHFKLWCTYSKCANVKFHHHTLAFPATWRLVSLVLKGQDVHPILLQHTFVFVCKAVCDHLFQGIVSIIYKLILPRGSARTLHPLPLFNTHVCFCEHVCFQARARLLVWEAWSMCVPRVHAHVCVCVAVLCYVTLNYNWGGNVTACDLILNTSITFSQFKGKCARDCVYVSACAIGLCQLKEIWQRC